MDAELAHLSMEEIRMWVELNLKLTRRTPLNGETSYEYHITPGGLRAHNLNTMNEAGRLNTRGTLRCGSVAHETRQEGCMGRMIAWPQGHQACVTRRRLRHGRR